VFQKLNKFGVPTVGMISAAIIPAFLVLLVKDMAGLADLYAIGVVGAIATNLGATSTDKHLKLAAWERYLMFATFLVMAAIELSLFYDKPHARVFAVTVLAVGLILRGLASERAAKRKAATASAPTTAFHRRDGQQLPSLSAGDPFLCAVRSVGRTLDFAIEEAKETGRPLYVLFVREKAVVTPEDWERKWKDDTDARRIFEYAQEHAASTTILPCYVVSDSAADTIVDIAATVGVSRLILGAPQRST